MSENNIMFERNTLNETTFEEHIAACLSKSDLYNQRTSADFDIDNLCDRAMLEQFLRQQTLTWSKLERYYLGREVDAVIDEYNSRINRGEGILKILRDGFTLKGAKIRFVQFKPVLDGPESENYRLYRANQFSVVRQMKYSTAKGDDKKELDLCILVNGIPLLTCELKNQGTGQHYGNGIYQYRYERNPQNRMLRNCLVHFVMDNNYVFMTTRLNGEKTRFLPFNQDSKNPAIEGEYPVAYMWLEKFTTPDGFVMDGILQADSLLDLIENFFKCVPDENGNLCTYFPRFHQLRAVRKLRGYVRQFGPGKNYLIQHSPGSGKTKSMAWLAHQMANMTNPDKTPIFDSIIMVTDRIVLNRNMANDVVNFATKADVVRDIRKGSKTLATALNEGHRIIISTVQKFSFALPSITHEKRRKYAIIVDEAHTAIGNESAKDLMNALSSEEDFKSMPDYHPEEFEDEMDAMMAYLQMMRRQMNHISYFAFTATPKDKTYALYGTEQGGAHDLYSMKQAEDEKFILNVLQNYVSYQTMFELIEKETPDEQKKFFEEKKALRVIYCELNHNSYIMYRKANMILEHFMKHTINKINKHAKAMLVTDSRRSAADYKQILDKLIRDQYNGAIKTLVAFSNEVEDSHGIRCSEASLNAGHVTDDNIRLKFMEDDFKILIVAEKFQTGFDQPLLHTMYVDKMMGGIQCIQTLSRLNRCYPDKEDTMVIDFRNDPKKVQKAFQQYYTETVLTGDVDPNRIYKIRDDVDRWNLFTMDEVNLVVKQLRRKETAIQVPSVIHRIVERLDGKTDEDKDRFRKLVDRYVRQYGFLAQRMDFIDPDLEKYYIFLKVLYKYLPYTKESLPTEIMELIDLDKLRIQLSYEGILELEDEVQELRATRIGELGKQKPEELKTVAELLDLANSPYKDFLDENDKILRNIWEEVMSDPEVTEAFSANNSYDTLLNIVKEKFDEKVADQIDKYLNFAQVIEKEPALSMTLFRRIVEAIARQTQKTGSLPYDEEKLKAKICEIFVEEFKSIGLVIPDLSKVVDAMFYIIKEETLPKYDGVNEILCNDYNKSFLGEGLRPVDRRSAFNSLCTKYEVYLKKLYYLVNADEIPMFMKSSKEKDATLSNCIHAFSCLWDLKKDAGYDATSKNLDTCMDCLRAWRNAESHSAPLSTDEEVLRAVRIVTAMYLYVAFRFVDLLDIPETCRKAEFDTEGSLLRIVADPTTLNFN